MTSPNNHLKKKLMKYVQIRKWYIEELRCSLLVPFQVVCGNTPVEAARNLPLFLIDCYTGHLEIN